MDWNHQISHLYLLLLQWLLCGRHCLSFLSIWLNSHFVLIYSLRLYTPRKYHMNQDTQLCVKFQWNNIVCIQLIICIQIRCYCIGNPRSRRKAIWLHVSSRIWRTHNMQEWRTAIWSIYEVLRVNKTEDVN